MEEITADDADVLCYLFYSLLFKDFFWWIFSVVISNYEMSWLLNTQSVFNSLNSMNQS